MAPGSVSRRLSWISTYTLTPNPPQMRINPSSLSRKMLDSRSTILDSEKRPSPTPVFKIKMLDQKALRRDLKRMKGKKVRRYMELAI